MKVKIKCDEYSLVAAVPKTVPCSLVLEKVETNTSDGVKFAAVVLARRGAHKRRWKQPIVHPVRFLSAA